MADIVDAATRSRMMSGIRGKDTKPELAVRRGLHRIGFRFRLHVKDLPGRPDLVLPRYRAVIFVNGCFWHGHDCNLFKWPKTRPEFWREKIEGNMKRDETKIAMLTNHGWRVATVWECTFKGADRLFQDRIIASIADWVTNGSQTFELRGAMHE
ncbi:MAG: very short patch repair endonuclease [Pseudomonadota bacterium]